jgi:hypothetical protein
VLRECLAELVIHRPPEDWSPGGEYAIEPIFLALVQATLVLIGPGALSFPSPIPARKGVIGWLLAMRRSGIAALLSFDGAAIARK